MQYYKCKCGAREAWGSLPIAPCEGCTECNTRLRWHLDTSEHQAPIPHQPAVMYNQHDGTPRTYCKRCGQFLETPDENTKTLSPD